MSNTSGQTIARQLPYARLDGTGPYPGRGGRYGEQYDQQVYPGMQAAADEGSFYSGTNASFGAGVAFPGIAAAFSATTALFTLFNKAGQQGPRTLVAYLRLIVTTASNTYSSVQFAVTEDNTPRGSAGTPVTMTNVNQDAGGQGPVTSVIYNPTVAAATAAARNVMRAGMKNALLVAGDEFLFVFGPAAMPGALVQGGATPGRYLVPCPPCIIGPGNLQSALFHIWFPGFTAAANPAFEFELGIIER